MKQFDGFCGFCTTENTTIQQINHSNRLYSEQTHSLFMNIDDCVLRTILASNEHATKYTTHDYSMIFIEL